VATKIGDLFFDVYADVSRAAKNVDDFVGQVKSAGSTAARAIGETIANAVGIAVGATALLTAATLSAGVAYNTLGQSATAAFSSIYQDLSAANDILQDISTLDLTTPFKGSALTATARTLAGFGFELENVVSTTEALAQATAAMGLGSDALHRMAIAFGQIQSRGKLAGDEARQLANYGIDAYGLLADQLGLTVAAVRELGQEGKLTSDFVIPALVDSIETRFAGATEKLFGTAAGQAEGLRSIMEGVGSALVEPFIGFSGGGALVEAMNLIRMELIGLVDVAEDGSFILQGFLAPLTPIVNGLADAFLGAAGNFAQFLGNLDGADTLGFIASLQGLGPLIGALGAGLLTMFAQAIPFVGRFVAGFNPIVVGLGVLVATSDTLRAALGSAFERIWDAAQPLVPGVRDLVDNLMGLAEAGIPIALDAVVSAFEDLAPVMQSLIEGTNGFVEGAGPAFLEVLTALADALKILADIVGVFPPDLVAVVVVLKLLTVLFPITTVGIVAMTSAVGLSGGAAALAATQFGMLATAVGIAFAAIGSFNAISAGLSGDMNYLNEDVPFYEKPFQLAGRFGFALGGGDREQVAATAASQAGFDAAENFNLALLGQVESFEEARLAADAYGAQIGLTGQGLSNFSNTVALSWHEVAEAERVAEFEANRWVTAAGRQHGGLHNLKTGSDAAAEALAALGLEAGEDVDILGQLTEAANRAWQAVEQLIDAGSGASVDDFLRGLPDIAEQLTESLAQAPGILRDLDVGGILGDVRAEAGKVIQTLAKEYGVGLDGVKALLDERGLAAVIDALGTVTVTTTETVDPLIAKYGQLGATAEQLREAIAKLNDQRQTAIRAQIDQVEAALDNAKLAAEAARDAVENFLSGGYNNSPQALVDNLIGDVGNIGSTIEDGLRQGGVRGEAAVRGALGSFSGQLAEIVNAGIEAGLSGAQIAGLLAPLGAAIGEEVGDAGRRILTQEWTEGITSASGAALMQGLAAGLDANAIQRLIGGILGADNTVAGLESRLEGLQADLQADVEFSAEQIQGALDEIPTTTTVEAVITPEAAQMVYDAIQEVFEDDDLKAAVDQALITQQILDAAQEAEDSINLLFNSSLSFNSAELDAIARLVGEEFYTAFNQRMQELRDEQAQAAGFANYYELQKAVGPAVAGAIAGGTVFNQTLNQSVAINGAQPAGTIAQEVIMAGSAATGTGGVYDPSKYTITTTQPNFVGSTPTNPNYVPGKYS
jgi:tape measure domain-containing protein